MNQFTKNLLIGAAAGLAATWIKSKVEAPLQEVGEKVFPPKAYQLNLPGADIKRQPENMPCAIVANNVYQELTGKSMSRKSKIKAMKCLRYATGAGIGMVYVSLANPIKLLRMDKGASAGALVWGLSHGSLLPKMKLQKKVEEMPDSWWVWEFGSHLIFGVAMEQTRSLLSKIFKKKK